MPTARPRHTITETEEIERALDDAAEHWPSEREARGKLLLHLIEEGHRALRAQREAAAEKRRAAIAASSGMFDDVYEDGYLDELRKDWPE
jgi:predicted NBD/HSP70 family sugar kinase